MLCLSLPCRVETAAHRSTRSFYGRGLGTGGADRGGDIGAGRIQAGGKSLHASGGSESDECNDQGILDEILTIFLHQVLHLCDKHVP